MALARGLRRRRDRTWRHVARGGVTPRRAATLVDGTTDTVTNIDPAGNYDFGSVTLDLLIFQHLLEPAPGGGPQPVLATMRLQGEPEDVWTCAIRKASSSRTATP